MAVKNNNNKNNNNNNKSKSNLSNNKTKQNKNNKQNNYSKNKTIASSSKTSKKIITPDTKPIIKEFKPEKILDNLDLEVEQTIITIDEEESSELPENNHISEEFDDINQSVEETSKKQEVKVIAEENKQSINKDEDNISNKDETDISNENNQEDLSISKDNNFHHQYKNHIIILILVFIILSIISIALYITIPKIKLNGSKHYQITYQEDFIDPGYTAHKLGKDISNKIIVKSNLIDNRVGNYQIIYQTKYLFLTIKKTRYIEIIDNIKPTIAIDNPVKLCPNKSIDDIKYESFDEYDGILTDKVKIREENNLLYLSVKDSSNNETNITTSLIKEDNESPIITLNGNQTIYLNYGAIYQELGYTAEDNCDGNLSDSVIVSGTVGRNIGTYNLTYTVKDSSDNETKITRTIVIIGKNLPNSGTINNGTIYLTFDDGPSSLTTGYILDILKEENVKATFFITGNGPDELIKRMYDEGHTVGLHTYTHNYSYIYSSIDNYFHDLEQISNRVKNITGYESKIIRFPGGSSNTVSRNYQYGIMSALTSQVLEQGYRYYDWNIDSNDAGSAHNSDAVYYNVVNSLSPNRANMVLMHDIKYQTKSALRDIIHYAKNNGYTFKKIEMDTYMIRHQVNN